MQSETYVTISGERMKVDAAQRLTTGELTAVTGGLTSVAGLAINEWMSIIGGICALGGLTVAIMNYRGAQRVRKAKLEEIKREADKR